MRMRPAVADTTLLSNFAHVLRPELPCLAFSKLVVPRVVLQEIAEGERLGRLEPCDWTKIPVLDPTVEDLATVDRMSHSLHVGEMACIALAVRLDAIVVTDDRDARHAAESMGLEVSGTLGALINLVERKHLSLDEGDELLTQMRFKEYRSPVSSLGVLL